MRSCSPEARACLALQALPGLGDVRIRRLIEEHRSAVAALDFIVAAAGGNTEAKALGSAAQQVADAQRSGASAVSVQDDDYPDRLRELPDAPAVVFARGTLESAMPPAVAIVGTRNASGYGLRVAAAIATACARAGIAVISGLARGIDAAAHEATLRHGGRTVAVLGTGIDLVYPRGHRGLQERIAQDGLLITEQMPGDPGSAGAFPRRNRLIAALADVTVVVEAGEGSGALITADRALELGRTVACVPNAIDVPSARGSNRLLKDHAEPILSPDDVLALLEMAPGPAHGPALDGVSAQCWEAVQHGARTAPDIARATALTLREVTAVLALLEIDGLVVFDAAGRVCPTVSAC